MKRQYWGLLIGAACCIACFALCGLTVIVADVAADYLQPRQAQAATADAKLGAEARCSGLIVIGCNVSAEQHQQQRQQEEPQAKTSPIAEALIWIGVIVFALLILFFVTR